MMISEPDKWKQAYQDDGFVIVPDLVDSSTLSALSEGMEKITRNFHQLPVELREKLIFERDHVKAHPEWYAGEITPEECGDSIRQISDLAFFDPAFARLICHAPLLDVLETLFASAEFSLVILIGRPKAARVGNGYNRGKFHRDTPFENYTSTNTIMSFLCLDEMRAENGPTLLIRGSHQVSDEEAKQPYWMEVDAGQVKRENLVTVNCPAGAGLFFNTKILHAAGNNRSQYSRRTILTEWAGPDALPTYGGRYSYQGIKPRSKDPLCAKQVRMSFPELFVE